MSPEGWKNAMVADAAASAQPLIEPGLSFVHECPGEEKVGHGLM